MEKYLLYQPTIFSCTNSKFQYEETKISVFTWCCQTSAGIGTKIAAPLTTAICYLTLHWNISFHVLPFTLPLLDRICRTKAQIPCTTGLESSVQYNDMTMDDNGFIHTYTYIHILYRCSIYTLYILICQFIEYSQ